MFLPKHAQKVEISSLGWARLNMPFMKCLATSTMYLTVDNIKKTLNELKQPEVWAVLDLVWWLNRLVSARIWCGGSSGVIQEASSFCMSLNPRLLAFHFQAPCHKVTNGCFICTEQILTYSCFKGRGNRSPQPYLSFSRSLSNREKYSSRRSLQANLHFHIFYQNRVPCPYLKESLAIGNGITGLILD